MPTTALGNLISGSQTSLAVIDPVDVDLIVHSIPQGTLQAGKSFSVACTLGVSASVWEGQQCTLSLTVQFVQLSTAPTTSETAPPAVTATTPGATNACLASSGHGYGIPYATIIIGLPRTTQPAEHEEDDPTSRQRFLPPQPMHGDEACYDKLRGVTLTRFLGPGGDNDSRGDTTTKTGAVTTGNEGMLDGAYTEHTQAMWWGRAQGTRKGKYSWGCHS
ncbi:hypothetical protein V8E52_003014 [Russula decolorans]